MNVYCISHGKEVFVFDDNHGHLDHLEPVMTIHDDFIVCFGPFAFCPPPELPEGWEQSVEPPTPDEMELIDQNATELALDLELA